MGGVIAESANSESRVPKKMKALEDIPGVSWVMKWYPHLVQY